MLIYSSFLLIFYSAPESGLRCMLSTSSNQIFVLPPDDSLDDQRSIDYNPESEVSLTKRDGYQHASVQTDDVPNSGHTRMVARIPRAFESAQIVHG